MTGQWSTILLAVDRDELVVHVRGATGVVRDDPDVLADPPAGVRRAGGQLDDPVLLGRPDDRQVRPLLRTAPRPPAVVLAGERLDARIEDVAVGAGVADDRRHDRQRAFVERRRSEADLLEVLEGVDPGAQLGDARDVDGVPRGRRAADRDDVDRHARAPAARRPSPTATSPSRRPIAACSTDRRSRRRCRSS